MEPNLQPLVESVMTGKGLYSLSEAAFYAKMPQATLSSWFFGRKGRDAYRDHSLPDEVQRFLTFDEFIEAVAIRSLRNEHKFSLQEILDALKFAEDTWQIRHIFSHPRHRAAVEPGQKGLFIYLEGDEDPFQISKKRSRGQKQFQPMIQDYLKLLDFDASEHVISYKPAVLHGKTISMQPSLCFGEPIVKDAVYPVRVLYDAYKAEGGIKKAADLYEVDFASVQAAVEYWESLNKARTHRAA